MSDSSLRLKQEIIKAEIIDKNYDKEKFLNFCMQKKERGDDLQNWSLLELNETISQFIQIENGEQPAQPKQEFFKQFQLVNQSQPQPQPQLQLQSQIQGFQPQNQQQQQHFHEQIKSKATQFLSGLFGKITGSNTPSKNPQQNLPNQPAVHYEKEIICKKLEKTILNDKEVEVVLKNPKSTDTSILKATYVTYEVVTESMQWLVRRRYSDFDWLRNTLVKCFPRLYIPPIPGKKLGNRRFEEDFIEKRMSFLQRFISNVMISEELKTSEALVAFLSLTDRAQFESKMKELTSFMPSPYVEDMKTLSGKLTAVDSDLEDQYFANITNYFSLQEQLIARLNYNFKNFYLNISAACTNLDEIQKDFDTLQLLNTKVAMKNEIIKTYEELSVFFKNWRRIMFNQNEIIKTQVKDFFKYMKMEGLSYTDLLKSREEIKQKYKMESDKLLLKKEKLWQTMDITKWEVVDEFNKIDPALLLRDKVYAFENMCTKETQGLENIHKQLGYANKMNMEELKKLMNLNAQKMVQMVKTFAENFYPSLTDGVSVWTGLNTYL